MMLQNKRLLWLIVIVQFLGFAIDVCHGVGLEGDCTTEMPCTVENSECVEDLCVCKTGFTAEAGACLKALGESCENADECVSNALCDEGTAKVCVCNVGYVDKESLCSKVLGSACTALNENTVCSVTNSECKGDACACKVGYTGDVTCSKIIGSACTGSDACSGDENTICKENKCECKEHYAEQNAVCTLTVSGKECSDTLKCEINNAVCDAETSKCKCDADFTMNVNKCDPKNAAAMAGFGAIVLSLSALSACLMMF